MNDNDRLFWSACFTEGYLNNKDTDELFDVRSIKDIKDLKDPNILADIGRSDISPKLRIKIEQIIKHYRELEYRSRIMAEDIEALGVFTVTDTDDDYPEAWRSIRGMPRMIFCRGRRDILTGLKIGSCAVVGSREPGSYASSATSEICEDLVKKDITIVSGMAKGIDRTAHKAALDNNGKTIAFLAGGPDNIYPWENKDIYDRIISEGLVITEMPPGVKAQRQFFPSRNRLISAISDTCLIMEAGLHSGTLHTASFAAAQGKSVYVLPNTIYYENALGGLKLIQDGANILLSADDVINEIAECCLYRMLDKGLDISHEAGDRKKEDLGDEEWKTVILNELSIKPQTSDMLASRIELPFYRLSALLSELEMTGKVEQCRGKFLLTISRH